MEVQKHLVVIERGVIKELLKLKTNACFHTQNNFFIICKNQNHVETITCAT